MSVFNGISDVVDFARGKKDYTPLVEGRGINKSSYGKVINQLLAPSIKTLANRYEHELNSGKRLRTEIEQIRTENEQSKTSLERSEAENVQVRAKLERSVNENERLKAESKQQKSEIEQMARELEQLRAFHERFSGEPWLYQQFATPNAKSILLLVFSIFEAVCTYVRLEGENQVLALAMSGGILFALITFTASNNVFGKLAAIAYAYIVGGVTLGNIDIETGKQAIALTIPTMAFLLAFDKWVMLLQEHVQQKITPEAKD